MHWRYEEEFSIYDMEHKESSLNDLMDSDEYEFFVGLNLDDEIVGYMECFFKDGQLEVGHGLNPDFLGKGLSYDFITNSIEFAVEYYEYEGSSITICVEPFNKRAIKVYSRIGFNTIRETDEYIEMELEL